MSGGGDDYARACSVAGYAGVIKWNGVDVLVLSDEPHATTSFGTEGSLMFVRWVYAPSEDAIVAAAREMDLQLVRPESAVAFAAVGRRYVLFDAGTPGREVTESIDVEMIPGNYDVGTYVCKPDDELSFLVHALRRV